MTENIITTVTDNDELLPRVLRPYAPKGTVYLKNVTVRETNDVRVPLDSHDGDVPTISSDLPALAFDGEFNIEESCYIDDTGHFNAVELLICYNQLMYSSLAIAIDQQLHSSLAGWSIEDFWSRQLPSILIYRTAATYRSPIDSTNMRARFTITEAKTSAAERGILKLATHVEFTDGKGLAYANIDLALVDLPEAAIEALTAAASPDDADSNG